MADVMPEYIRLLLTHVLLSYSLLTAGLEKEIFCTTNRFSFIL